MFLSESELDCITVSGVRYLLKPEMFVQKPHFTTKKKTNVAKVDYLEQLSRIVVSATFMNFAEKVIEGIESSQKYGSYSPENQISKTALESGNRHFLIFVGKYSNNCFIPNYTLFLRLRYFTRQK